MLTGIGIIIILKQIPHFLGYDDDPEGWIKRKRRAEAKAKRELEQKEKEKEEAAAAAMAASTVVSAESIPAVSTEENKVADDSDLLPTVTLSTTTSSSASITSNETAVEFTSETAAVESEMAVVSVEGPEIVTEATLPPLTVETVLSLPSIIKLTASVKLASTPTAIKEVNDMLNIAVQRSMLLSVAQMAGVLASLTRCSRMFEKHYDWHILMDDIKAVFQRQYR